MANDSAHASLVVNAGNSDELAEAGISDSSLYPEGGYQELIQDSPGNQNYSATYGKSDTPYSSDSASSESSLSTAYSFTNNSLAFSGSGTLIGNMNADTTYGVDTAEDVDADLDFTVDQSMMFSAVLSGFANHPLNQNDYTFELVLTDEGLPDGTGSERIYYLGRPDQPLQITLVAGHEYDAGFTFGAGYETGNASQTPVDYTDSETFSFSMKVGSVPEPCISYLSAVGMIFAVIFAAHLRYSATDKDKD